MSCFLRSCFVMLLVSFGFVLDAADSDKPVPAKADQKKTHSELMEYGPFITATIGQGKQVTNKGVAVRLGKDRAAYVCFDTEALRMSAAWTGAFIDYNGLAFKGGWNNARGPNIAGDIRVETRPGPGWARGDDFTDPRAHGDGPLPADWARYRGLYLDGDQVVFSYTVGDCAVLESPSVQGEGETAVFIRSFRMGPSAKPLTLLLCDLAGGTGKIGEQGASLVRGDEVISVGGASLPAGANWSVTDGRIVLKLPALAKTVAFSLAMAKAPPAALAPALGATPEDLEALTHGGPPRWHEPLLTKGVLGSGEFDYLVDTLTAPDTNPWNAWMRFGGFDFFADGRAALCTWSGDVWIVSGIDEKLDKLQWKRFATGLFQPLGLKIIDEQIYVLCHGPILRLHDLDHDGEADFYECFNNDCMVTNSYHEFACDLQSDSQGNLYFTKGAPALVGREKFERYTPHHGTLLKVSKDGGHLEVVANGFREPNGLCIGPGDLITVTDNQGNWQPGCPLNLIRPGGFYGMPDPASTNPRPPRDPPLCWLPYTMDNSSGGQVWVTSDRWGPLKGQMLLTSYGKCALFSVMMDPASSTGVGGAPIQAAVVKFPLTFSSGIMRPRFSPRDGQLYVCGLRSWGTAASTDGVFQRVRYSGKPVRMPIGFHVAAAGIELRFTCALDPQSAGDAANYSAEWYTMVESKAYGSPEFSVADPAKKGRDPLPITAAKLSADGKAVMLDIPGLKPVMDVVIRMKIKSADGTALTPEIGGTINRVPR